MLLNDPGNDVIRDGGMVVGLLATNLGNPISDGSLDRPQCLLDRLKAVVSSLLDPLKLLHNLPRDKDAVAPEFLPVIFEELVEVPVHQEAGVSQNLMILKSLAHPIIC